MFSYISILHNILKPPRYAQASRYIAALIFSKVKSHPELASSESHQSAGSHEMDRCWHQLTISAIAAHFQTDTITGLSAEAAEISLQTWGRNTLPKATPRSAFKIFFSQFITLPVALLTVAAALSLFTDGIIDAVVIMGVVGINAVIGYLTESQSEKIIFSLKTRSEQDVKAIRSGAVQQVQTEEIVPGDLICIQAGTFVAADARIISAQNLVVNEAALTGESRPAYKTPDTLDPGNLPLSERSNMVYKGTLVMSGHAQAIVVATGIQTELGKIQQMVDSALSADTPLQSQLNTIGRQLVILSCAVCGLVFALGLLRGYELLPMLKISISLAVAAVPEGLPAIATTTLALGIQTMRQRQIFIRTLAAVEALGAIETICLDKTGTITENKMAVSDIQLNAGGWQMQNGQWIVSETELSPTLSSPKQQQSGLFKLMQIAALCSSAELQPAPSPTVVGSATEIALMEMLQTAGLDGFALRSQYPLLAMYPRTQTHPVMSTVHAIAQSVLSSDAELSGQPNGETRLIAVKGSPVVVLSQCDRQLHNDDVKPLTEADCDRIKQYNQQLAGKALRVLGFAYKEVSVEEVSEKSVSFLKISPEKQPSSTQEENLIWVGLVGLSDPIRAGVSDFIQAFHQAGIKTLMITGDQQPTAKAIAQTLQLNGSSDISVLDAAELANLDEDWSLTTRQAHLTQIDVFSRVSPADKLSIVQTLQHGGQIVAMTGDGINDTPALKAASVGIAMGAGSGNGVHDVADVVIADNNLSTLVDALARGRTTYLNIRKSVHFLLSTNLSEIIVTATMTAVAIGSPLSVMQLLWLNLVTDIFPGLALALEPPEANVLTQPPRDPHTPIIRAADFKRILFEAIVISLSALSAYSYALWQYGAGRHALTVLFMALTIGQVLHTLSCRSEKETFWHLYRSLPNPYVVGAIALSLSLQLLPNVVPSLMSLLKLTSLTPLDWTAIIAFALLPLLINECTKLIAVASSQQ